MFRVYPYQSNNNNKTTGEWTGGVDENPGVGDVVSSSDLKELVRAVVSMPGWVRGNAITFFATGTGTRTVEAFEGGGYVQSTCFGD